MGGGEGHSARQEASGPTAPHAAPPIATLPRAPAHLPSRILPGLSFTYLSHTLWLRPPTSSAPSVCGVGATHGTPAVGGPLPAACAHRLRAVLSDSGYLSYHLIPGLRRMAEHTGGALARGAPRTWYAAPATPKAILSSTAALHAGGAS